MEQDEARAYLRRFPEYAKQIAMMLAQDAVTRQTSGQHTSRYEMNNVWREIVLNEMRTSFGLTPDCSEYGTAFANFYLHYGFLCGEIADSVVSAVFEEANKAFDANGQPIPGKEFGQHQLAAVFQRFFGPD